ncbi:MAG: urease accessory protein [Gemmatimonadales bacterium]
MLSILTLGFLMGMQHALEADHLAAVSSIASEEKCAHRIVRHGVAWGIGHSITLLGFAGAAILLRGSISDWLVTGLEFVVGVMLVLLGSRVIYRLTRDKVHIHVHRHADGAVHLHAHSHRGERTSGHPEFHEHEHKDGFPLVTLCVGLTHGMAGSAALLILAMSSATLPILGLLYVAIFGAGSILGMAALSAVISVPLTYSARQMTGMHRALQALVGIGASTLGLFTIRAAALAHGVAM